MVVGTAIALGGALIVTNDPQDITRLTEALDAKLPLYPLRARGRAGQWSLAPTERSFSRKFS